MDVRLILAAEGGVAPMRSLEIGGASARAVQRAAERGDIRRVRTGWYSLPDADPLLVLAVRSGGAVGCLSGCVAWVLWSPPGEVFHLVVPRNARRILAPAGTIVHWTGMHGAREPLVSVQESVRVAVRCAEPADAFAVVESAMRSRRDSSWMPRLLLDAPADRRDILKLASSKSESGTESIVAYHLLRLGIPFLQQVEIPGVGRVDFVIGDRLIVEADSEEHHGKPNQRRQDLERDAHSTALGFATLRLDYTQVMFGWETAELALRAALAQGVHLGRRLQMS